MTNDVEFEQWREQWRAQETTLPDLRRTVERESRVMRLRVVGQVAVTVIFGFGSAGWAVSSRRSDVVVLAVAMWTFLTAAWAFSLTNTKGLWAPDAETTDAFLRLSMLRRRRRLHAITFSSLLYVVILSFNLVWLYHHRSHVAPLSIQDFLSSRSAIAAWVLTVALARWAVYYRRSMQRELKNLSEIRRRLDVSATFDERAVS